MAHARAWTIVAGMAFATLMGVAQRAEAVTLKEIMELTRVGVGDDVLVALIEVDQRVFPIDSETLATLKQAGVSDRVMVAIVKSGRTAPPAPGPLAQDPINEPPPPPQVYVVEREPAATREVVVPVPVYIAVPAGRRSGHVRQGVTSYDNVKSSINPFGVLPSTALPPANAQPPAKPKEPVYWGWGGKRRPDTWDPDPQPPSRKK